MPFISINHNYSDIIETRAEKKLQFNYGAFQKSENIMPPFTYHFV
jgi:hypothetical protein